MISGFLYLYFMSIWSFIGWSVLLYLLYKLVFGLIIPVYRATKNVRKQFRNMQSTMQDQFQQAQQQQGQQQHAHQQQSQQKQPSGKRVVGDYIDFEEVK